MLPVDAVVTWVDSTDKAWQQTYKTYVGKPYEKSIRFTMGDDPEAELRNCLALMRKNMPWLRNVFVLTLNQRPKSITSEIVVDHREIGLTATFNSHAIETSLHKIKGLSEHFIYINDDTFVVRPVKPSHFFHTSTDWRPRVRLDRNLRETEWVSAVNRSSRLIGMPQHTALRHAPYPLTKSIMVKAELALPKEWQNARTCRVRYTCDELVPVYTALLLHLRDSMHTDEAAATDELKISYWPTAKGRKVYDEHVICVAYYTGTADDLRALLTRPSWIRRKWKSLTRAEHMGGHGPSWWHVVMYVAACVCFVVVWMHYSRRPHKKID